LASRRDGGFQRLSQQGDLVVKVNITPTVFPEWCSHHGVQPNATTRSEYASIMARDAVLSNPKPPSTAG
jgi:hypothetical protein